MKITTIELHAIRKETNNYRFYFLSVSKDMFNYFVVTAIYGRIGTKGTQKTFAFKKKEDAQSKVKEILRRRHTSHSRIGVNYIVKNKNDPNGILNVLHQQS